MKRIIGRAILGALILLTCCSAFAQFDIGNPFFTAAIVRSTASAGGSGPASVSDLALWLKADSLSLSDNDPVSTWADSSGLSHDATASLTERPVYKASILNSLPVVRFDGVNDWLSVADTATLEMDTDSTVFVVLSFTSSSETAQTVLCKDDNGGTGAYHAFIGEASGVGLGKIEVDRPFIAGGTPSTSAISASTFVVLEIHISGTTVSVLNGGVSLGSSSLVVGEQSVEPLRIGTQKLGGGYSLFLKGDVAELCVYNRALSAGERTTVRTYLQGRYGL